MSKKTNTNSSSKNYVYSKTDDGTIEINYTIPLSLIEKTKKITLKELGNNLNVPGFRKGKAPIAKIKDKINSATLIEKTLNKILPSLLGETINTEKLNLAIYPKFELLKADENKDWEVRAISCELPKVKLGDYKKELTIQAKKHKAEYKKQTTKNKEDGEFTKEQKEHIAIHTILEISEVKIPQILINEEVNSRLSKLLERIEKLGLSLENYLASLGKNIDSLKKDYESQATEALTLDLALPVIAQNEKIEVSDKDTKEALKLANLPESQRPHVHAVLRKRATLDKLVSYIE